MLSVSRTSTRANRRRRARLRRAGPPRTRRLPHGRDIDVDVHEVRTALLRAAARPPGRCRWSRSSRSGWWPAAVGGRPRPGQGERGASRGNGSCPPRRCRLLARRSLRPLPTPGALVHGRVRVATNGGRLDEPPRLGAAPRCPPDDPPCDVFPAMRIPPLARPVARPTYTGVTLCCARRSAVKASSTCGLWADGVAVHPLVRPAPGALQAGF
jgi:hypothetical protein